jgi:hypothetical protein
MISRSPDLLTSSAVPRSMPAVNELSNLSANTVELQSPGSKRSSFTALNSPSLGRSVASLTLHDSADEQVSEDAVNVPQDVFVYIPSDSKQSYKRLFELALEHDLDAMGDLPPDEDVSLSILIPIHEELVAACASRWRIMEPFKTSVFVALVTQQYKYQRVPTACVAEALNALHAVESNWAYWRWPWSDRHYLFKNLAVLFNILLSRFYDNFQSKLDHSLSDIVELLERIHANELFLEGNADLPSTLQELQYGLRTFISYKYSEKRCEVEETNAAQSNCLHPFLIVLEWLSTDLKTYRMLFPTPFLQYVFNVYTQPIPD